MQMQRTNLKSIYKLKAIGSTMSGIRFLNSCQAKIGEKYYATLDEAIAAADNSCGTTITLLSDVELHNTNIYINRTKNIELDLAGHKITSCNEDGTIYLEGALTVTDSSEFETGLIENTYSNGMGIYFYKSGYLNLVGGTIRGYCALYSWNDFFTPEVTINGGIIDGKYFGVSFSNVESLMVKSGVIRGGIMAFNIWGK